MIKRPPNDPHFTWQEGDVTFNIPIQTIEEDVVAKDKNAPIPQPKATGPAPLPFFMWMKLKPQHRPGGPE